MPQKMPVQGDPTFQKEETGHGRAVREMFEGIAPRYDLLNHLLSANIDRRWRRRAVAEIADVVKDRSALILDAACGTGDLSIEIASNGARVIGSDFCGPMLDIGAAKCRELGLPVTLVESDALALPFYDSKFDAVTVAFGLRNFSSWEDGLLEFRRVLKPNGGLVILEFSSPVVPGFRRLFSFYFSRILPALGGIVSGSRSAYEYLPRSVGRFPDQKGLARLLREAGFSDINYKNLSGGIAAIHTARRP